jgi:hypothetical protein
MEHKKGSLAEKFVLQELKNNGIKCKSMGKAYYDILITSKGSLIKRIEVKSCSIAVKGKNGSKIDSYRFGRFNFENQKQRKKLRKVWAYVCFVVRWKERCFIIGFINFNSLTIKSRFIRLNELRDYNIIEPNEFYKLIKHIEIRDDAL